ncbi:OstA-like protein [Bacteroidota bacterium]
MMLKFLFTLLIINFSFSLLFAQSQDEPVEIIGDSLRGRTINGDMIREVIGNVIMTQGNVKITCDKAIQYLDDNRAELIGNVVAVKDTIIIYSNRGYYSGDSSYVYSDKDVRLEDGHITLTAETGYYFFDSDRAEFYDSVKLVDSNKILIADNLNYFNNEDKAIAVSNVRISDNTSVIYADSLIHFRDSILTYAYLNIRILNSDNNLMITGNELFDNGNKNYTEIRKNPILSKIDTSENGDIDTLVILCKEMRSIGDTNSVFIASDSVKIIRGNFYSINNYSMLLEDEGKIITYKRENDLYPPILWYNDSQLFGDSINIFLTDNEIDLIDINYSSLIISIIQDYELRFDQVSGEKIKMYFSDNGLKKTLVENNVLSIYYLFEGEEPNGLLKSSSEEAKILFDNNKVIDVKLYGSVKSEYHPEKIISGTEIDFTLPSFILYNNKPDKNKIFSSVPNF